MAFSVNSRIKLNFGKIKALEANQIKALEMTTDALLTEVKNAQVMPFGESVEVEWEERIYGKRGQFAKNGREYKGKEVTKKATLHRGGNLQNESTFPDYSDSHTGVTRIVSSTPYARRLYYHPEYNFNRSENIAAGGKWLEPWKKGGTRQNFCASAFAKIYKELNGT